MCKLLVKLIINFKAFLISITPTTALIKNPVECAFIFIYRGMAHNFAREIFLANNFSQLRGINKN